jgi:hypothetical protein
MSQTNFGIYTNANGVRTMIQDTVDRRNDGVEWTFTEESYSPLVQHSLLQNAQQDVRLANCDNGGN